LLSSFGLGHLPSPGSAEGDENALMAARCTAEANEIRGAITLMLRSEASGQGA
jgi:hypothetical protein